MIFGFINPVLVTFCLLIGFGLYVVVYSARMALDKYPKTNLISARTEVEILAADTLSEAQRTYFQERDAEFADLGFRVAGTFTMPVFAEANIFRLYLSRSEATVAKLVVTVGRDDGGRALSCMHITFTQRYATGGEMVTRNNLVPSVYVPHPKDDVRSYPHITDITELKRLHDERLASCGKTLAGRSSFEDVLKREPEEHRAFVEQQVACGLLVRDPATDDYNGTPRHALLVVRNLYNPFQGRRVGQVVPSVLAALALPALAMSQRLTFLGLLAQVLPEYSQLAWIASALVAFVLSGWLMARACSKYAGYVTMLSTVIPSLIFGTVNSPSLMSGRPLTMCVVAAFLANWFAARRRSELDRRRHRPDPAVALDARPQIQAPTNGSAATSPTVPTSAAPPFTVSARGSKARTVTVFVALGLILVAGVILKSPRQRGGTPPARKQSVGFAAFRTTNPGRFAKTPVRIALPKDWRFFQRSDNLAGGTICDSQGTPLCEAHVNITSLPKVPEQDPLESFVASVTRKGLSASRLTISNAGYQTVDGQRLWLQRSVIKEPLDPFFSLPRPTPADKAFRRRGPSGSLVVAGQRDDMIVQWIFLAHQEALDSVVTQALPWVRQAVIGTR